MYPHKPHATSQPSRCVEYLAVLDHEQTYLTPLLALVRGTNPDAALSTVSSKRYRITLL